MRSLTINQELDILLHIENKKYIGLIKKNPEFS